MSARPTVLVRTSDKLGAPKPRPRSMTRHFLLIALSIVLAGCRSLPDPDSLPKPKSDMIFPTKAMISSANYGPEINKVQFENTIRNGFGFFDPYSAVIICTEPRKGASADLYSPKFGYFAKCKYNAKNRYGGYVGEEEEMLIINNGVISRPYPGAWQYAQ